MSSSGKRIRSLEPLSAREVQSALAAATSALLPDPGVATESRAQPSQDVIARILEESRNALGIEMGDESIESRTQLLEFLSDELIKSVLANANEKEIKNRLGASGDLRDDLFTVSLTKDRADNFAKLGIHAPQITDAVRYPDRVQHLQPEEVRTPGLDPISIVLQLPKPLSRNDPYSLLVLTTRKGGNQVVDDAFRIYHSEIAITETTSPLAALRAFLDRYGLWVVVGNHSPTKLSVYEVVPFDPRVGVTPVRLVEEPTLDRAFYLVARIRQSQHLHVIEVAMAYAVDLRRYTKDLNKHGVRTTL
jgi:hypothetical protein